MKKEKVASSTKRQQKKKNAELHNMVYDIKEHLMPIGDCHCGETIFMYLKSNDENIFKYYCVGCPEIRDIRNPNDKDKLFFGPQDIVNVIGSIYGEEKVEKLFETNL